MYAVGDNNSNKEKSSGRNEMPFHQSRFCQCSIITVVLILLLTGTVSVCIIVYTKMETWACIIIYVKLLLLFLTPFHFIISTHYVEYVHELFWPLLFTLSKLNILVYIVTYAYICLYVRFHYLL